MFNVCIKVPHRRFSYRKQRPTPTAFDFLLCVLVNSLKFYKSRDVWLQGLMGVFYSMEAVAFIDDMPIDFEYWKSADHNWKYIKDLYFDSSLTCFITMGCYMFTFTLSIIMFFINKMLKWANIGLLQLLNLLLLTAYSVVYIMVFNS